MSINEMLPSVSRDSLVNSMCVSTKFRRLKKVLTWFFFTILMISSTCLFHHGLGVELLGPNACSLKCSI